MLYRISVYSPKVFKLTFESDSPVSALGFFDTTPELRKKVSEKGVENIKIDIEQWVTGYHGGYRELSEKDLRLAATEIKLN